MKIRGIGHGYTNKVRTGCLEEERKKVWNAAVDLRSRAGAEKGREGQKRKYQVRDTLELEIFKK